MQIPSLVHLLLCCIWATLAQKPDGEDAAEAARSKKALDEPIQFVTKPKDQCSLRVTEVEDVTKLRVQCRGQEAAYWCEYEGKPGACRSYIANPRHYFTQIMWELRKLQNACQGPQTIKPPMCKKASNEAQLTLTIGGSSAIQREARRPDLKQTASAKEEQAKPEQAKPVPPTAAPAKTEQSKPSGAAQKPARPKPAKPQPIRPQPARPAKQKPDQAKPASKSTTLQKVVVPKTTTQAPATTAPTRTAENMAQEYCWHSIKDFCTQVFSWFKTEER